MRRMLKVCVTLSAALFCVLFIFWIFSWVKPAGVERQSWDSKSLTYSLFIITWNRGEVFVEFYSEEFSRQIAAARMYSKTSFNLRLWGGTISHSQIIQPTYFSIAPDGEVRPVEPFDGWDWYASDWRQIGEVDRRRNSTPGLWIVSFRILHISILPAAVLGCHFVQMTIRHYHRRFRQQNGLCISCGYDLRASTGICPECGTPMVVKQGATT